MENFDLPLLSSSSVFENAVINRPEIKAVEYRLKSSETSVSIARSGYYPNLSVSGNLGSIYFYPDALNRKFEDQFSNNFNSSIGINFSIPIFNRLEVRNSVKNAKIELESYKLQILNTKLELRKTIEQSYLNAVAAKSHWEAANKSEKASREAYRFANEKYESGLTTQYDLFNAKNNLAQVLAEQTRAKYEYIFRIKILTIYNE